MVDCYGSRRLCDDSLVPGSESKCWLQYIGVLLLARRCLRRSVSLSKYSIDVLLATCAQRHCTNPRPRSIRAESYKLSNITSQQFSGSVVFSQDIVASNTPLGMRRPSSSNCQTCKKYSKPLQCLPMHENISQHVGFVAT